MPSTAALLSRRAGYVRVGGGWCSYRPKFEIGIVDLLARKKELATAPGTTNTRPLGGRTEIPEFGVPSKSRTSRFRAVKNMPASLVHTETKMNTHKHFEAGIELHSLSIVRYNRNINGMRPKFKESTSCPLNPPHADRLVHTSHTPPSRKSDQFFCELSNSWVPFFNGVRLWCGSGTT